ncbi:MAG: AAA family ATPase [Elusimicrobiales bacterium]|nr:AAA family ATPase [Elusimicrobiales bacterium]
MYISRLNIRNWRNFLKVDVNLQERMFFVGPNASGKSNLLDIFRFLHDIAKKRGGGLQQAIADRGGISKIRCLATRSSPDIVIGIELLDFASPTQSKQSLWKYEISLSQEPRGDRLPVLRYEKVWHDGQEILARPKPEDEKDPKRLTQTHLEQINANEQFREIAVFLQSISYLHLVPQVIRHPEMFPSKQLSEDPFGVNFLAKISETNEKTRHARLKKIEQVLSIAVPQLKQLSHAKDARGLPHLEAIYSHWRIHGARQQEDQFSDGTLRLIGFLWSLLESDSLLLLEEPELSLNSAIVRQLPALMYRMMRAKRRQVFITTHSTELLSDGGIAPEEVLMLTPQVEGTDVKNAGSDKEIKALIEGGLSVAEVVIPKTAPQNIEQLEFQFQ